MLWQISQPQSSLNRINRAEIVWLPCKRSAGVFLQRLARFPVFLVKLKSRAVICADTSEYAVPINKLLKGVYLVRSDPSSEFDVDIMVY